MKMTQAWGWLTAGVLAAGMNASYHNGGLQWAHQVANHLDRGSSAVLALASGRADQILSEARLLTARDQTASCPLSSALERVQAQIQAQVETRVENQVENRIARSQAGLDLMSAREQAQLARLEANRARMEAQLAARTAHIRI
jgi:hypothetical protein